MGTRPAILVDTNIVIEAVRVGAWERLRAHESVVTVGRCCEEALSGKPGSPGRVPVTEAHLAPPLTVIHVTEPERALFLVTVEDAGTLHDGEIDLLAHAKTLHEKGGNPAGEFVIVCADQAAVRVAVAMGLGDRIVSLEEVLRDAGIKIDTDLKSHYTRQTLSRWKTRHMLGI